ncbi:MAG: hypothetical protein JWN98_1732 [Abditibacteriota bacterium]|nr:hypothetical protein [Abditibacteriota bacterium]
MKISIVRKAAAFVVLVLGQTQSAKAELLPSLIDKRTVVDMIVLDLEPIAKSSDKTWVIAKIVPDNDSSNIQGVEKDPQSGKTVAIQGAKVIKPWRGSLKLLLPLIGTPKADLWSYEWEKPARVTPGGLVGVRTTLQDFDLPFQHGGIVVCGLDKDLKADTPITAQFPLFLLPTSWQNYVAPALEFHQKNETVFQVRTKDENSLDLIALLRHENPLISLSALRALLKRQFYDEEVVQTALLATEPYTRAVSVALLLWWTPVESQEDLIAHFKALIEKATTSSELEGLTMGLSRALLLSVRGVSRSDNYRVSQASQKQRYDLLKLVQDKHRVVEGKTEADEHLLYMFQDLKLPGARVMPARVMASVNK